MIQQTYFQFFLFEIALVLAAILMGVSKLFPKEYPSQPMRLEEILSYIVIAVLYLWGAYALLG